MSPSPVHRIAPSTTIALSLADRKILSLLQQNGRTTLSQIARQVKLSVPAVSYRIDRLMKEGVIRGFQGHVQLLPGFQYVMLRFHSSKTAHEKLSNFLANHPQTITLLEVSGEYDLAAGMVFLSGRGEELMESIRSEGGYEACEWNDATLFIPADLNYTRFTIPRAPKGLDRLFEVSRSKQVNPPPTIGRGDVYLLQLLARDCRASLQSLASATGMSPLSVKSRMKTLIQEGVLLKFFASVNPYAIGTTLIACVWVRLLDLNGEANLLRMISRYQIGNGTARLTGQWTHVLFLHFISAEEMFLFEGDLRKTPSLMGYQIQLVQSQSKLEWIPPYVINNSKEKEPTR